MPGEPGGQHGTSEKHDEGAWGEGWWALSQMPPAGQGRGPV